ncbi:glycoside hydrolase family 2 protein [Pedobacter cryoconitis]|uniref:glycoside hydrolase family 2 protein n=1 Tax=Pedobacter cryoconitis TaxID=188932 RepID=UPI0016089D8C|nr:glycoside hydrolase family 2 TIM barrel-domain containing protein [Pedobacter cryoconitis]MBB5648781.1 beta-galactosidase [Pedobacter cryoconitis]
MIPPHLKPGNLILTFICLFSTLSFSSSGQARKTISFNQDWMFSKTNDTVQRQSDWKKVTLPHTWNATDMQLTKDFYEGEGQYKKQIVFGREYKDKRLFLRFEGVGQVAQVYVNQKLVGMHKGSYSAFCLDITYAVKIGEANTILVKVNNKARKDIIPVNHFLFGIYGGIYRPVSLLVTNKVNITTTDYAAPGIYISQKNVSAESAEVSVAVKVENIETSWQDISIKTELYDQAGKLVAAQTTPQKITTQGRQKFVQHFQLQKPHLWNGLKNPYLYKVITKLLRKHDVIDKVTQPLGLRKFEIIAGKGFFLNNQLYPMHGVCRHQDRWQFGNALSNAQHREDLDIIKEMGATTIRFAHYQQAEYLYSTCDTMGFVTWAEIPFVNTSTGEEADNAKQQLMELIKQNYNHPSLYVWGLHNEVYGKTPSDFPAVLTRELNDIAKTEDPDRYTVSVSGYGEMDRPTNLNADIQGMNRYYGWYEGKIGNLEDWAKEIETKYPAHKVILTEYGADGNIFQQQEQTDLKDAYDYTAAFYPESFETKTHEVQWPIIAKHPGIAASYIWNMFDFATPMWNRGGMPARNMKGLVTFDRQLKKDAFYWYKANWSKDPVLYLTERRVVERKHAVTPVVVYSNIGQPALFVNGKMIAVQPIQGTNSVQFIFKDVHLKKGKNSIKTLAKKDSKTFTDTIEWVLK